MGTCVELCNCSFDVACTGHAHVILECPMLSLLFWVNRVKTRTAGLAKCPYAMDQIHILTVGALCAWSMLMCLLRCTARLSLFLTFAREWMPISWETPENVLRA